MILSVVTQRAAMAGVKLAVATSVTDPLSLCAGGAHCDKAATHIMGFQNSGVDSLSGRCLLIAGRSLRNGKVCAHIGGAFRVTECQRAFELGRRANFGPCEQTLKFSETQGKRRQKEDMMISARTPQPLRTDGLQIRVGLGPSGNSNPWGQTLKVSEAPGKKKWNEDVIKCAASTGGRDLYQPFRRPPQLIVPPPINSDGEASLSIEEQLEILRDRQGLWFVYATVIPSLTRAGFTPSEIDEATGLNGHEQNKLVVGAQVRDSLIATGFDMDAICWFDVNGAELLYELRTLSAQERKAAACFVIERNMDAKLVKDLARSIKDFARRKNSEGFSQFTTAPGDCLAFSLYRQSKETSNEGEVESFLKKALEFAVTGSAKAKISSALLQGEEETAAEPELALAKVTVMRLSSERIPLVLPVSDFSAIALQETPSCPAVSSGTPGTFNILQTSIPWKSWIAIPSWRPIASAVAPVALLVPDGSVLPKHTGIQLSKDPILVVVDKGVREIGDDSFFLVATDGGLTLEAGPNISTSQTVLGKVLIALKPPLPEDPNLNVDWE